MTAIMGFDIGGTKIETAVFDATTKQEILRKKIPTPGNYTDFMAAIKFLVDEAEKAVGESCLVGMGFPGIITKDGILQNYNNLPFLKGDIVHDVEKLLSRRVKAANDADCFALSETFDGAAKGANLAFCAILGTGNGAGITFEGKLLQGKTGCAGEWGHISQPYPDSDWELGQSCSCGGKGHIEALNSAPALVRIYNEKSTLKVTDSAEIYERYKRGEQIAGEVLNGFYGRLARAFVAVSNLIDPDVFVLGGGLSQIDEIYDNVPALYAEYMKKINGISVTMDLRRAEYGASSGLRGAAWLCLSE